MALTKVFLRRLLRTDVSVFVLLIVSWWTSIALLIDPLVVTSSTILAYAGLAALGSLLLLHGLNYFDSLRIVPRESDVLLMVSSVPLGGVLAGSILLALNVAPLHAVLEPIWYSPITAVTAFLTHYLVALVFARLGSTRKVVIDLLPQERAEVLATFANYGLLDQVAPLTVQDLSDALSRGVANSISLVIISHGAVRTFEEDALLIHAHLAGIPIVDSERVMGHVTGRIRLANIHPWGYLLGATPQTAPLRVFTVIKQVLEPVVAAILAVLFLPVMGALALLIKLSSPGPILYRQRRTGYRGVPFTLLKFRSMRIDAELNGPQWAAKDDNRVTKLGGIMRATRLDELPQLWNIIRGEMSFVGPRPERPEIYEQLKEAIPLFYLRTAVRPGITGWAQVHQGYVASVAESEVKLEYDLYYIQHMSPRLDLVIVFKTVQIALFGERSIRRPEPVRGALSAKGSSA